MRNDEIMLIKPQSLLLPSLLSSNSAKVKLTNFLKLNFTFSRANLTYFTRYPRFSSNFSFVFPQHKKAFYDYCILFVVSRSLVKII